MRLGLAIVLALMVAFSGLAQESDDWYQGKPIKNIVFEGLRQLKVSEFE